MGGPKDSKARGFEGCVPRTARDVNVLLFALFRHPGLGERFLRTSLRAMESRYPPPSGQAGDASRASHPAYTAPFCIAKRPSSAPGWYLSADSLVKGVITIRPHLFPWAQPSGFILLRLHLFWTKSFNRLSLRGPADVHCVLEHSQSLLRLNVLPFALKDQASRLHCLGQSAKPFSNLLGNLQIWIKGSRGLLHHSFDFRVEPRNSRRRHGLRVVHSHTS